MTVRVVDHGWERLKREVFGARIPRIEVGIFGSDGDKSHDAKSKLTVLQVGIFNEFGLGVPERSFIRGYFDENKNNLLAMARKLMVSAVDGKRSPAQICDILGLRMVAEIQKRIAAGIAPPNAESTIARKGSSVPLIDTGLLRSSITYRVRP